MGDARSASGEWLAAGSLGDRTQSVSPVRTPVGLTRANLRRVARQRPFERGGECDLRITIIIINSCIHTDHSQRRGSGRWKEEYSKKYE